MIFIQESLGIVDFETAERVCNPYGQKITKKLVGDLMVICTHPYKENWWKFKEGYGLKLMNLQTLCDAEQQKPNTFGRLLHNRRKYLNDRYNCNITPK